MTVADIRRLEYQGGGYFRLPGPTGEKRPIAHAPELVRALLERIDALEAEREES